MMPLSVWLETGLRRTAGPSARARLAAACLLAFVAVCVAVVGGAIAPADKVRAAEARVTWSHDVAPIMYKNCTACHHAGGSGPFSLVTYPEARRWGGLMEQVTASRYMPPWLPAPGHGEFADSRRLSERDIAMVKAWVAGGMAQGDDAPKPPVYTSEWELGPPDLVLSVTSPTEVPASGPDVFENFALPANLTGTRWVRAMEIKPGSPQVVHHANVILDRTAALRRAHPNDWQRGVPGMDITIDGGKNFDPDSHFLFWKPDSTALVEPESMPWRLDPGNDLVLNMHLKPTGKVERIQARIGLYFAKAPATQLPMLLQLEHDDALDIPAGDAHFVVEDTLTLPEAVEVLAVYPHAHYLGKRMEGFATLPTGETKWLVLVPDWDIERQAIYRLSKPLPLPKGTVLHMRYTYDNSASNPRNPHVPGVRVRAGNNSTDEMGHLWLQVLPMGSAAGSGDARIPLERAWMQNRLSKDGKDTTALFNLASMAATAGEYTEASGLYTRALEVKPGDARVLTGLGTVQFLGGDAAAAQASFQAAVTADPQYADARFDLAKVELERSDFAAAEAQFRALLGMNAKDVAAEVGLGSALLAQGRNAEGAAAFRAALLLDPENFDALYNEAQIAAGANDFATAERDLTRALAVRADADAERTLAIVLASENRMAEALPHMQTAAKLAPSDADVQRLLARLQGEMKR